MLVESLIQGGNVPKPATKAEKEHMALVKSLPCVVCYEEQYDWDKYPFHRIQGTSEYDHLVDGYRLGHMFGLPLCTAHHIGKKRYGGGIYWDSSKPNQWKLLEKVYKVLVKEIPDYRPKINNFKERI